MEMYLKRYYWAAILGCIASSAFLVARSANTFVGSALEPAPLIGMNVPRSAAQLSPMVTVDATPLGHLFGIVPPAPVAVDDANGGEGGPGGGRAGSKNICWKCEPVKTGLRLQLLATMVSSDKQFSTALIADLERSESGLYQIGDQIRNADVHDIIRDPQRVVIVNYDTHRLEYIDGTPGTGMVDTTRLGVSPVPPPGGGDGITKTGDGNYEITREKLNATLSDMNDLAVQARIVPSFRDGQSDGFKLFSIQPGSLYSQIGIQNGDVVERINGYDINSPEKALEAYTRLKDSSNIQVTVLRQGQPQTLSYAITP